jgi:hypothetical protein
MFTVKQAAFCFNMNKEDVGTYIRTSLHDNSHVGAVQCQNVTCVVFGRTVNLCIDLTVLFIRSLS